MALPNSYTIKTGQFPAYFDAIINAQAPERFSTRFLEKLDFKSTNDRLLISVLKDLGFINEDGVPTERYFRLLDRSQWQLVLAEAIRDGFSDLFAVNQKAHELATDEVTNKLRTLYAGAKTDLVISRIAKTFTSLCEIADFRKEPESPASNASHSTEHESATVRPLINDSPPPKLSSRTLSLDSLQYHINIVLPESRDQSVYDAIFRSLKEHLVR